MKRFSSYGPPSPHSEFMIERSALVRKITQQLIGNPEDKGHYFTIFAPRQRGKSTTLRSVVEHIRREYPDQFHVGMAILHLVEDLRTEMTLIFQHRLKVDAPKFQTWDDVRMFFSKEGPLTKPVILILDEFDALPDSTLEETISFFRSCYHDRQDNWLHGVALIGVHSSLGKLEGRTSPFNVQRAVNVPNFTREEVFELYGQYQAESGQRIEAEGVERIYDMFRGQPGLTCWFGELLTEKRNLVQPPPCERKEGPPPEGYPLITRAQVERVMTKALYSEININIRNLISKGMQHQELLRELFVSHDVLFDLNEPNIQWLYLNGILVGETDSEGADQEFCAFASPFVQRCLFSAFGRELQRAYSKALLYGADEPIALGHAVKDLDVPSLLALYRKFLARQEEKGAPPWSDQPSRTDARAFEAIGHFNLYAWLYGAAKGGFSIVPEFPTGNGTADLLLKNKARDREEVLEVKSFTTTTDLERAVIQAARYARKLKRSRSFLVVMADASAYEGLRTAPTQHEAEGVTVALEVIPWGFVPGRAIPAASRKALVGGDAGDGLTRGASAACVGSSGPHAKETLPVEERLELELLIAPLLTPTILRRLWGRSGLSAPPVSEDDLLEQWDALLNRCLTEQKFTDLVKILRFTFPQLNSQPLLERLQAEYPG